MTGNNNSRSKIMVPEAKAAMDKFKMEAAGEVGVTLNKGYNGSLTSMEAGSIGSSWSRRCVPNEQRITGGRTGRRWGTG